MSSSSKIVEAYAAITRAYGYSPFDKSISSKYKTFEKRFKDKKDSIENFVVSLPQFELEGEPILSFDCLSGETFPLN